MNNINYINEGSVKNIAKQSGNKLWRGTKALGRSLSFGVSGVWSALVKGSDKALDKITNEFVLMIIYGQEPKKSFIRRAWDNIRKRGNIVRALKIPGETKSTMLDDINRCMAEVYKMYFSGDVTLEQIQGSFTGLGINTVLTMSSDINTISRFIFNTNIVDGTHFEIDISKIKSNNNFDTNIKNQYDEDNDTSFDNNDDYTINDPHDDEIIDDTEISNVTIEPESIDETTKNNFNRLYTNICNSKINIVNNIISISNYINANIKAFYNVNNNISLSINLAKQNISNNKTISTLSNKLYNDLNKIRNDYNNLLNFIKNNNLDKRTALFESSQENISSENLNESINNLILNLFNENFININNQIYDINIELYNRFINLIYSITDSFIDIDVEYFQNINPKNVAVTKNTIKTFDGLVAVKNDNKYEILSKANIEDKKKIINKDGRIVLKNVDDIVIYMKSLHEKFDKEIKTISDKFNIKNNRLFIPISDKARTEYKDTIKTIIDNYKNRLTRFINSVKKQRDEKRLNDEEYNHCVNIYNGLIKSANDKHNSVIKLLNNKLDDNLKTKKSISDEEFSEDEFIISNDEDINDYHTQINGIKLSNCVYETYKDKINDIYKASKNNIKYYLNIKDEYNTNIIKNKNEYKNFIVSLYNIIVCEFDLNGLVDYNKDEFIKKYKSELRTNIIDKIKLINVKFSKQVTNKIYVDITKLLDEQINNFYEVKNLEENSTNKFKELIINVVNKTIDKIENNKSAGKFADFVEAGANKIMDSLERLNVKKVKDEYYKDLENKVGEKVTNNIIKNTHNKIYNTTQKFIKNINIDNIKNKSSELVSKFSNLIYGLDNNEDTTITNNWKRITNKDEIIKKRDEFEKEAIDYSNEVKNERSFSNKELAEYIYNEIKDKSIHSKDEISKYLDRELQNRNIENKIIARQIYNEIKDDVHKKFNKSKTNKNKQEIISKYVDNKLNKKHKENNKSESLNNNYNINLSESDIIKLNKLRKKHNILNNYISESEFNKLNINTLLESEKYCDKILVSDLEMLSLCLMHEPSDNEHRINERLDLIFNDKHLNEELKLSKPINELSTNTNNISSGNALFNINFSTNEITPLRNSYDISDLHRLISLGGAFADNYLNKTFSKLVSDMLKTVTEIASDRDELKKHMRTFIGNFMNMIDSGADDDNYTRFFMGMNNMKVTNTGQGMYIKRVTKIAEKIVDSGDMYIKAAGAKYKKLFTKHEVEEFNEFRLSSNWEAKKIILQRATNSIFESIYQMPVWSEAVKFYFSYYPIAIYLVTSALANGEKRSVPSYALENAKSILTTKKY